MILLGMSMRRVLRFGCGQMGVIVSSFKVLLLFVLSGAVIAPSVAQTGQQNDRPRTIHGVVVNAVTGAPIPRALVRSMDDRLAALTDGSGAFEFTLPQSDQNAPPVLGASIYTNVGPGRPFRFGNEQFSVTATKPG